MDLDLRTEDLDLDMDLAGDGYVTSKTAVSVVVAGLV